MSPVWNIYGKKHDLTEFMKSHPGGQEILDKTKNQHDITSMFETYHAFSDKAQMRESLKKYEVSSEETGVTCDYTEYHELIQRIKDRTNFKTRHDIKAPFMYYVQNTVSIALYVLSFYGAASGRYNTLISCCLASLAGVINMSIGFNILHDGSHYAISINPLINTTASRINQSLFLWNHSIWFFHHVYHHHSFTNQDNDPDVYHYIPFAKKNINRIKGINFGKYTRYVIPFVTMIFPGMYTVQGIAYFLYGYLKKKWSGSKLPKDIVYYSALELLFITIKLFCLYCCTWPVLLCYLIAMNTSYHLNIVGDHDTYETHVENKYTGNSFLRLQVCNSGNFLTEYPFWQHFFGGINYQIEHHLIPSMSHKHYHIIAPIVKEYCKEKNIPYVDHQSLLGVYKSFLKMIDYYADK